MIKIEAINKLIEDDAKRLEEIEQKRKSEIDAINAKYEGETACLTQEITTLKVVLGLDVEEEPDDNVVLNDVATPA